MRKLYGLNRKHRIIIKHFYETSFKTKGIPKSPAKDKVISEINHNAQQQDRDTERSQSEEMLLLQQIRECKERREMFPYSNPCIWAYVDLPVEVANSYIISILK